MDKITVSFSITVDAWMAKTIDEMRKKTNYSRSYMTKVLLKSKLLDMGYSEEKEIIEKLKNNNPKVNDDTQLSG